MEYYVEIYDLSKHVYLFITLVCMSTYNNIENTTFK